MKNTRRIIEELIDAKTIVDMRESIRSLFEQGSFITVILKKSKARVEEHRVKIVGVYQNLFTVENPELKLHFSIQYIDVLTKAIQISE